MDKKLNKFTNNNTLPENLRRNQLRYDVKKKYGLTLEEVSKLRTLPCEICGILAKKMCIDHKVPQTFRGVLCQQCNTRLGWLEKNFEVILNYKERGPQNAFSKI
jgi:Recombination endonuclease VII